MVHKLTLIALLLSGCANLHGERVVIECHQISDCQLEYLCPYYDCIVLPEAEFTQEQLLQYIGEQESGADL